MTLDETLELFEQIALIDDRVIKTNETEQTAQLTLWARVLRDVPLDFAGQALGDHYAESAWPVMPKDIAARWRTEARRRLDRHVGTFEPCAYPQLDPDDVPGYRAALRAEREGVRRGGSEPLEFRALMAASDPVPAGRPNAEYLRVREEIRRARTERAESEVGS